MPTPFVIVSQPDRLLRRFQQLVRPVIRECGIDRLVVAYSGGADSTALLNLFYRSDLLPPMALYAAHFDHGLRPDSQQDADFTEAMARQLGVAFIGGRWQETSHQGNLQDQARQARYRFLVDVARSVGARYIVTGHHQDDQAETLLDRLLRGSGIHGLTAMPPRRLLAHDVYVWRPLLSWRRQQLRLWLQQQQISWREESSNSRPVYRRNCLRLLAMPVLKQCAGYDPVPQLTATVAVMAQANAALDWLLDQYEPTLDLRYDPPGVISLSRPALAKLPDEAIVRCLLRRYHTLVGTGRPSPGGRARLAFVNLVQRGHDHELLRLSGVAVEQHLERVLFSITDAPLRQPATAGP
ncbi:MAG: tRNA lysidine(34) synthetase TilS [Magnetococcales bacterium]|nr:tRNA lysidine(34) synthetase TilS [Magnetococcales bacterium]